MDHGLNVIFMKIFLEFIAILCTDDENVPDVRKVHGYKLRVHRSEFRVPC